MIDRNFYSSPKNLPNICLKENLINSEYPLSNFPISRYWHYERRQHIFNIKPPGIPNCGQMQVTFQKVYFVTLIFY